MGKANLKIDLRARQIGEDSIDKVHIPLEDTVFGMILAYRKAIATGSSCGGWPDLPIEETARHPDAARLLPRIARSDFLARRRVFFLGGGYFMQPQNTEDGTPYLSPSGEPEIRRIDDQTDNAHRAVDALRGYPARASTCDQAARYPPTIPACSMCTGSARSSMFFSTGSPCSTSHVGDSFRPKSSPSPSSSRIRTCASAPTARW